MESPPPPQDPSQPQGPQSPEPGGQPPAPQAPPPAAPVAPGQPPPPAYPGPVPPGGWQQPVAQPVFPYPLAGWWSRVAAQLIDWLIVGVPGLVVFFVLLFGAAGASNNNKVTTGAAIGAFLLCLLLWLVVAVVYAPLTMRREGERNGQTWGKQALGIRAIRDNGVPFDFGYAALREVVVKGLALWIVASVIPVIPYLLDYLWPLWDDSNRALHDMVCSTHVVQS